MLYAQQLTTWADTSLSRFILKSSTGLYKLVQHQIIPQNLAFNYGTIWFGKKNFYYFRPRMALNATVAVKHDF